MDIHLLGPVEVTVAHQTISLPGAGERALLALLALQPGRVVSADRLIDGMWGEDLPANPVNALQLRVSKLRKALASAGDDRQVVVTRSPGYLLDVDPGEVDAQRFVAQVQAARQLVDTGDAVSALDTYRRALSEWRGPALGEFTGAPWGAGEARRLEELRLAATEERLTLEIDAGRHTETLDELEALIADHPLRERLHALLMLALYRSGRQADALATYQTLRSILDEELGLDPSAELTELERAILRQDDHLRAPERHPDRSVRPALPQRLASFVGRDNDVAEVVDLLAGHRLVTVTGAGGTGKTTLAIEAARAIEEEVEDGVWFVSLAGAATAANVTASISDAFGLPPAELLPGDSQNGRLARQLGHRRALVVLDNCEHVVDAVAATVQRLLADCPHLSVLATSREALAVGGEVQYALGPLPTPDPSSPPETLRASPAVQLFVDRAAAVSRGFAPTGDDLATIARICARLDGMPLAIELAAARIKTLSPCQLADRLDDRLRLLASGPRTAEARHRTLRATVDWSYRLLNDSDRTLFRRVGALRTPWTLEDAEEVCGFDPLAPGDVLEVIGRLIDRSLVVPVEGTDAFRMLETIRQFAEEELRAAGEYDEVMHRHLHRLRVFAATADVELRGRDQVAWLDRLRDRHDDLRAALAFCVEDADAHGEAGLELASSLGWFWYLGDHEEGRRQLHALLEAVPSAPPALRGRAYQALAVVGRPSACVVHPSERCAVAAETSIALLSEAGDDRAAALAEVLLAVEGIRGGDADRWLAMLNHSEDCFPPDAWEQALINFVRMEILVRHDEVDAGLAAGQEAAAAFARHGDLWGVTAVRAHQGHNLRSLGRFEESLGMSEQALDGARRAGLWNTVQLVAAESGIVRASLGDADGARALLEEATAVAKRFGYLGGEGLALVGYGHLARRAGDLQQAERDFAEATGLLRRVGSLPYIAWAESGRGYVCELLGDLTTAGVCHRHVMTIARSLEDAGLTALAVEGLAGVATATDARRAAALLGLAARIRRTHGRPPTPLEAVDVERITATAAEELGTETLAAIMAGETPTDVAADADLAVTV